MRGHGKFAFRKQQLLRKPLKLYRGNAQGYLATGLETFTTDAKVKYEGMNVMFLQAVIR
jgi:hypothetical protein